MRCLRPLAVCLFLGLAAPVALAQSSPETPPEPAATSTAPTLLWIGDLDTNRDGRISAQEVAGRPELVKAFASMDLNHDGYLASSEVQTLWQQRIAATNTQQHAARLQRFDQADTNKDGKLSEAELEAKMPRLAKSFAFLDENHDGSLSATEFTMPQG